ncbi:MAG TPA: glycosyltransferase [Solirubrobacteraceae bacterium]|nr:glycosyltransferase [Solirubrobacteraceae bacterium]
MPGVLFISYSGIFGGAERVLLDCATALEASVVVACPPGLLARRARGAGLPVLTLPVRSLALRADIRTRLRAVTALADHAVRLRRLTRALDPDLIIAWGMRSAIAWLAGSWVRPAVVSHNDFVSGPLVGVAMRAAAARAEAVLVPSDAVAADLDPRRRLGGRLHVVPPGVDVERFATSRQPVAPPEVLVLGALAGWKRPDLALEICALARRRIPELRLRLVGTTVTEDPALPARLGRRAQALDLADAVEIAGPSADPATDLARATCLLHCAPREPFGLVVLEALAAGRPVVVPDAAGPREIVDASCARLYPPGDAGQAAAALVELISHPGVASRAGAAGREVVRRRFSRARTRAAFAETVTPVLKRLGERDRRHRARAVAPAAVTLVTVSHNSAAELATLLDSVARYLPEAHTVVIDCASADESVAVARARPAVEVVALEENIGFGRACNRGMKRVHTPVTTLVNPDVELVDASLLGLAAEALRDDRGERLLAPRVLNGDGSLQDTVHPLPGSAADLIRSVVPPVAVPGRPGEALAPWRSDRPRRVGWAVGCALVARTATLRALGPFDESVFMYGEDLELGLHARERGVETWLWPTARVVHRRGHATERAFGGEAFERLARGRHEAVKLRRGARWAAIDDAAQALTFASRGALKRALGLAAARERRQLEAVTALRRPAGR